MKTRRRRCGSVDKKKVMVTQTFNCKYAPSEVRPTGPSIDEKKRSISFLRSPVCGSCSIHSLSIIRTEKLSTPQNGNLELSFPQLQASECVHFSPFSTTLCLLCPLLRFFFSRPTECRSPSYFPLFPTPDASVHFPPFLASFSDKGKKGRRWGLSVTTATGVGLFLRRALALGYCLGLGRRGNRGGKEGLVIFSPP